eukprot:13280887-Alexandrium_andersonii.AAC.1
MKRLKECHNLSPLEPDMSFAIAFVQSRADDDDAPLLQAFATEGSDELAAVWFTAFKYYSLRMMVRASSLRGLRAVEIVVPLEFAYWRDAYAAAHDDALANQRPIRIE